MAAEHALPATDSVAQCSPPRTVFHSSPRSADCYPHVRLWALVTAVLLEHCLAAPAEPQLCGPQSGTRHPCLVIRQAENRRQPPSHGLRRATGMPPATLRAADPGRQPTVSRVSQCQPARAPGPARIVGRAPPLQTECINVPLEDDLAQRHRSRFAPCPRHGPHRIRRMPSSRRQCQPGLWRWRATVGCGRRQTGTGLPPR